jgi:formate C-acetyltransferase
VLSYADIPTDHRDLIDAAAWERHHAGEGWLAWRARRCAERLMQMPLNIEPGERIVGKPLLRDPEPSDRAGLNRARDALSTMPPFPISDAGHFHPDFDSLFRLGVGGILEQIADYRAEMPDARDRAFYDACATALAGLSSYARRVAQACEALVADGGPEDVALREAGAICRGLAERPPATFREAIQLLFLTQIALWFGEGHLLTAPGRLDRTLWRCYQADRESGRISAREAFELLCCLFIQQNRILQTGSAISVLVGGRDEAGRDTTNELTYLCLAARLATRLSYPTVGVAWHQDSPSELMDFAVQLLSRGIGDPAFFNDAVIVNGLMDHDVSRGDAHNYMNSTCVEIKPVGCANIWVTSDYFNCPQALLDVMADVSTGVVGEPDTFADLQAMVRQKLAGQVRRTAREKDRLWHQRAIDGCFPLASCLIKDCLATARDFDRGGARYNWVENSFVGLANLVDSLLAVNEVVYERGEMTVSELHQVLADDFRGHQMLRQRIMNTVPKYGCGHDLPDRLAADWAEFIMDTSESNIVGSHRYVPGFFCWIMHAHMGAQTGATPDGRRARWPLADGAGAAQGRETCGPTASVLSTTRWSHRRALGGLVHNVKFPRKLLEGEAERRALRSLIETYLSRGGFEIQVNSVGVEDLLEAREHPELHPDLLVRVAGYSDYFVKLSRKMQEEIIARTEHTL